MAGLSSCATPNYMQPNNDSVATVSFSNLSDELAEIYIVTNDKTYSITSNLIERKKPQEKSKYKTNIKTGNEITFKYDYNWLMSERTEITSTYSKYNTPTKVNAKIINVANTCSTSVSFVPEENKHYEVYFGLIADKCIIKASEVRGYSDSTKQLISIKSYKL